MISLSNQKCPKALFGKTDKHQTLRVIHYHFMLGSQSTTAGTPGKHIDPIAKGLICTTITNDSPSIKTLIISLSLWRNKNNLWGRSSTHPQTDRHSVENLIQMYFSWVHRQDVNITEWNIGWATGLETINTYEEIICGCSWQEFEVTVQHLKGVKCRAWQNCMSSTWIEWKLKWAFPQEIQCFDKGKQTMLEK